jgi:hypothetical protein
MLDYRESGKRDLHALLAAAVMLAGCGGAEEPPIDSGCIDCDRFFPDPCGSDGGDGCMDAGPGDDPPFRLAEGGELRLERFQDSADGTVQTLAAQAFFFKGQTPPARSFGDPEVDVKLREELLGKGYVCADLRAGIYFDSGKTPEAQAIVDTRSYYDVGATATLTSTVEPFEVVRLDKSLRDDDPEGATDLSPGLQHAVLYKGDPQRRIPGNMTYRPSIAGSADYPTLDLKWGQSVDGEEIADPTTGAGTPQIYMPSAFVLTSPTDEEFFTPGALTFTRGQDLTINYTFDPAPADWPNILPFFNFVDGDGKALALCIKAPTSAAPPEDGELIVPFEVLEIVDPNGRLIVGRLVHIGWEYGRDRSRVDLIGIESKRSPPYTIVDAAN